MAKKGIFGFGKVLKSNNFAKSLGGGVGFWGEIRLVFVEFLGVGGGAFVLGSGGGEILQVFDEPISASFGKSAIDLIFIGGKIFKSGLIKNRTSVHLRDKLHNRKRKVGVAI